MIESMKCPYCGVAIHEAWSDEEITGYASADTSLAFIVQHMDCPACEMTIIHYSEGTPEYRGKGHEQYLHGVDTVTNSYFVLPRTPYSPAVHSSVPKHISDDLTEAMLVLPFSAKASAALSRRCLQNILIDAAGVKREANLVDQIGSAVNAHGLSSGLRKLLTAVRQVGNYAAHPIQDKHTGVIVDVEPGEAELNISTLEALIDFFYIRPAEEQEKLDEINRKLSAAGKAPIT